VDSTPHVRPLSPHDPDEQSHQDREYEGVLNAQQSTITGHVGEARKYTKNQHQGARSFGGLSPQGFQHEQ